MTAPSTPALDAIWQIGASRALATMAAPVFSSPVRLFSSLAAAFDGHDVGAAAAGDYALSSTAARVAFRASSMRELLLLHLGLSRRADLDDRHAAGELRQALLELSRS